MNKHGLSLFSSNSITLFPIIKSHLCGLCENSLSTLWLKSSLLPIWFFMIFAVSCNNAEPIDLTEQIVGIYDGTVSLYLGTDSIIDVANQQVDITRVDDEHIQITPVKYPSETPVSGQTFTALLTRTPFGFIRTAGVMLTIESISSSEATINGTPYLVQGGDREAHGRYNEETGELIFAFEVVKNGVVDYELFEGERR